MHLNIQCIKNKIEEIALINLNNHFHIICFTEHWANENKLPAIKFENFNIASAFCRTTYIHGGTLILARDEIWCKEILCCKKLTVDKHIECCAIKIKLCDRSVIILNIYRSPDGDLDTFFVNLELCLNLLTDDYFIVWGDFNIDLLKTQ